MALPHRIPDVTVDAELAQTSRDALDRLAQSLRERYGENWAFIRLRDEADDVEITGP